MDPEYYTRMNSFMRPQPPINEQQQGPSPEASGQPKQWDTNWTVVSPDATRGNLGRVVDPEDVRMSVGWRADSTAEQRRNEESPWLSNEDTHPFTWSSTSVRKDLETTPTATDHYPHPNLSLPHPSLNLDFRMSVTLNPKISVGPTPFGQRNWISFTGGTWSGSWGSGIVLPGGQDSQLIIPDGSAFLDTKYILQTHDSPPSHIFIKTHGWRTGTPEILAKLADPEQADTVDPNSYRFRIFIEMETGDERYRDRLNCGMWVGSGMKKGAEVVYDAYRVS